MFNLCVNPYNTIYITAFSSLKIKNINKKTCLEYNSIF